nr:immunoglobulin heavy chain junction region [Macaca mulatta]
CARDLGLPPLDVW